MDVKDDTNSEDEKPPAGPLENAWSYKVPEFKKGDMKHPLAERSNFIVLFPQYREAYLKESWPLIKKMMKDYGIKAELDVVQGCMKVSTTGQTWDPYAIIQARDVIKLLSRSVPFEKAMRIFNNNVTYEIVKIRGMVRNKERFVKRRNRLIGSGGVTLKAIELLTDCYVLIQGATVAIIGPHKGVKQAVDIVNQTMQNIHPVYLLKALSIKQQLADNPDNKNLDWSRFLPQIQKRNVMRKKAPKKKKEYTPFPPPQLPRKVDLEMESGAYTFKKAKQQVEQRKNRRKTKQQQGKSSS